MQRPGFLGGQLGGEWYQQNILDQSQRSCMFYNLLDFLLDFSDEDDIYSKISC